MGHSFGNKYFFSLKTIKPLEENAGGRLTRVDSKSMTGLVGISFESLILKKRGFLKPIWYPNAYKMGYCSQGQCLVTLHAPGKTEIFTVEKGEIFFIPQGYIHQIQQVGDVDCALHFALSHTLPEVMSFEKAIQCIPESVFAATFQSMPGFVNGLKQSKNEELISVAAHHKSSSDKKAHPYKFNIDKSNKEVLTKGGFLQLGIKNVLPILKELGMLGFELNVGGVVEPHWHTNAGELIYIRKGKTRIALLSPDRKVEVLEVNEGELAFAPASYFHFIENIGAEKAEVCAFFSHAEPDYIGIAEAASAYTNEELASIFDVDPNYFKALNKPRTPLVIVPI